MRRDAAFFCLYSDIFLTQRIRYVGDKIMVELHGMRLLYKFILSVF